MFSILLKTHDSRAPFLYCVFLHALQENTKRNHLSLYIIWCKSKASSWKSLKSNITGSCDGAESKITHGPI